MSVPLNRAQRGRQSGSGWGCLQPEEGEKEGILLLSRRHRQTDRQGGKGQHRPKQGNPAHLFVLQRNFLSEKENNPPSCSPPHLFLIIT